MGNLRQKYTDEEWDRLAEESLEKVKKIQTQLEEENGKRYLLKDRPATPQSEVATMNPVFRVVSPCECILIDNSTSVWVEVGTLLSLLGCDLRGGESSFFMYEGTPILVPNVCVQHEWGYLGVLSSKFKSKD